jgi:hypothetical protein
MTPDILVIVVSISFFSPSVRITKDNIERKLRTISQQLLKPQLEELRGKCSRP